MTEITPALVQRLVARLFPLEQRAAAGDILAEYGAQFHEKEGDRVRVAALKLCGGDLIKLEELILRAKRDYRDLLAWAEYPEETRKPTWRLPAVEQTRIRQADRAQYEAWLRGTIE